MKFKLLEDNVDIDVLIDVLNKNRDDWDSNITVKDTSGLTNITGCIPLTLAVKKNEEDIDDAVLQQNTEFYDRYIEFPKFAHSRGFSDHNRMGIFKLDPGQMNAMHNEEGLYYNNRHRYHLSLNGIYELNIDGEVHIIYPGMFFWFNNKLQHSATNIAEDTRISFVFDVLNSIPYNYNGSEIYL